MLRRLCLISLFALAVVAMGLVNSTPVGAQQCTPTCVATFRATFDRQGT